VRSNRSERQNDGYIKPSLKRTIRLEIVFIILTIISVFLIHDKTILWFGISMFGGSVLLVPYWHVQVWFYDKYAKKEEKRADTIWWIPTTIGILERAYITLIVSISLSGAGSFIMGWIVLKMALGWQSWGGKMKSTRYKRGVSLIALIINLISAMIATIAGYRLSLK
jgi:hypothetical protein